MLWWHCYYQWPTYLGYIWWLNYQRPFKKFRLQCYLNINDLLILLTLSMTYFNILVTMLLGDYACIEGGSLKKHMRIHNDERPFKWVVSCLIEKKRDFKLYLILLHTKWDKKFWTIAVKLLTVNYNCHLLCQLQWFPWSTII